METLRFHELTSSTDPYYPDWMALYHAAFPLDERLSDEVLAEFLALKTARQPCEVSLLAALDAAGQLAGLACFKQYPEHALAYLWYLAVANSQRGNGLGTRAYRHVLSCCRPGTRALIFEVEQPETGANEAERELRRRRIRFYQRLGAEILEGADFVVQVSPELSPVALTLMVHRLLPLTVDQLLHMLDQAGVIENLRPTGQLRFAGIEPA